MWWINVNRLGISIRCAILYVNLIVSMIVLSNTICAILYVFLFYIYAGVYMYVCVYLYVYICVCIYMYVWVCMYRYICIFLRSVFFFSLSFFSFLVCVPYSCIPTVPLEVDVQTLKPPGAKPRTGKYVRVGYKKKYITVAALSEHCLLTLTVLNF